MSYCPLHNPPPYPATATRSVKSSSILPCMGNFNPLVRVSLISSQGIPAMRARGGSLPTQVIIFSDWYTGQGVSEKGDTFIFGTPCIPLSRCCPQCPLLPRRPGGHHPPVRGPAHWPRQWRPLSGFDYWPLIGQASDWLILLWVYSWDPLWAQVLPTHHHSSATTVDLIREDQREVFVWLIAFILFVEREKETV